MKKFLKTAAIVAALTMSVSAIAEAQGGDRGGAGGGGRQGGGRGGAAGRITMEGVSADSAYNVMMAGITLDATKKTAVMALLNKFQTEYRALPAPAGRGGRGGGGTPPDSATMAANAAAQAKRMEVANAFRTEVKKHLNTEQNVTFDATFPPVTAGGGRRGGGGGGIPFAV